MTWLWVLAGAVVAMAALGAVAWLALRSLRANPETRRIGKRLQKLGFRKKLRLGWTLWRDRRMPMAVRLTPLAVLVYLAMPLDIIPDFLPVIGQLDDVLVLIIGAGALLRFTPGAILEEHLARIEAS